MDKAKPTPEEACLQQQRDSQPYATNNLIVKVAEDAVTRVQNPPEETIRLAREEVDANEK